jgi:acyl-CoA synthetase (AMP-forming)/AMP-acid ligase II
MPKGVMWPHKSVFYAAMGGGGWFHPDGAITAPEQIAERVGDFPIVGMALAPLMHGACWWYACIQLLAGNTVVLNPAHSLVGEEIWDIVAREKVNAITIVGDAMAVPLQDPLDANPGRWDLSTIFSVGSGGAVFSISKQEAFKRHFPNVFITNSFGSSESGNMGMDGGGKRGQGLGNVSKSEFMSVISTREDGSRQHVKPGQMGIFARSGHIPVGYYNDPEKTAQTIVEVDGKHWLLLGDEARLEDDNSITVFGRGSNCINTGGEKVFPEEVEQALKANPDIFDCLVVGTPDDRYGSKVVAIVATRGDAALDLAAVQEDARRYIAGYKVPRELHLVAEVPRAPSGKPAYPKALEIALSGEHRVG